MAALTVGDVCYVDYGEIPHTIHVRLLGAHIDQDTWAIITPDGDIYDEIMSIRNPDFVNWVYGGAGLGAALPPGIAAGSVYGFGPITALQYQQYLSQARVYAAGARALLGLPPAGGPHPPGRPAPAAVSSDPDVWVSLESEKGYLQGQVVVQAGGALPVGHVSLGDSRALIPVAGGAIAIKKIKTSELRSLAAKDLRVLSIKFDNQGMRSRSFAEVVADMSKDTLPGGDLQLEGPPTCIDVLKALASRNLTPITDHERWIRTNEISRSDRSIYEMEVISKVIEALTMVDQLNLPNLKGGELLLRRWQLIKEAHRLSPQAPDYSAADFFMGWEHESGVNPALSRHVADQLKDRAAIAKESRKAKEEANLSRGGGRGKGKGRNASAETSWAERWRDAWAPASLLGQAPGSAVLRGWVSVNIVILFVPMVNLLRGGEMYFRFHLLSRNALLLVADRFVQRGGLLVESRTLKRSIALSMP